ncbi:tol-pal system protein YbgF [Aquincola sp. MAHUQ-54]|uniref:Cell division coordinator CpoB n=1 Tax=Aquincola agrisoli TaxID=3119538 RepID=A0AAW9QJP9_9BURK
MRRTLIATALAVLALGAQAALFEDDEARRAILDLRTKQQATDDLLRSRLAELNQSTDQMRRSLLDLNAQLEALRSDNARLRGQQEQLLRDVAELQRQQKDIAQGVDERMRKLEPQKVSLDGKEFLADPEETRQYEAAVKLLRGGDFAGASDALNGFVRSYPRSGYLDSARFWLGNALYGKRDYKESIATFRSFLAAAPQNPRAPEALLAVANTQVEMKDAKAARATLNELLKAYPQSEAAVAGKERLAALK